MHAPTRTPANSRAHSVAHTHGPTPTTTEPVREVIRWLGNFLTHAMRELYFWFACVCVCGGIGLKVYDLLYTMYDLMVVVPHVATDGVWSGGRWKLRSLCDVRDVCSSLFAWALLSITFVLGLSQRSESKHPPMALGPNPLVVAWNWWYLYQEMIIVIGKTYLDMACCCCVSSCTAIAPGWENTIMS